MESDSSAVVDSAESACTSLSIRLILIKKKKKEQKQQINCILVTEQNAFIYRTMYFEDIS